MKAPSGHWGWASIYPNTAEIIHTRPLSLFRAFGPPPDALVRAPLMAGVREGNMSQAKSSFEHGIKDAEELLAHFDAINCNPPPANAEVLKRAGLVMALTAWETYVEDRITEAMDKRLSVVSGSYVGEFIQKKLQQELKQFHNPTSDKTKKIFQDYLGLDVTSAWSWANVTPEKARKSLNQWISKRGDAVHRSKPINNGSPAAHLIKKDELEKVIRFLKDLVRVTDEYLDQNL